jgi:hypothetical protein
MNSEAVEPVSTPEAPEVQPDLRKPVVYGDFYPFAKKTCPTCIGLGYIKVAGKLFKMGKDQHGNEARVQVPGLSKTVEAKVCGCAVKRFMKKHGTAVDKRLDGALVWKEEASPIQTGSTNADG